MAERLVERAAELAALDAVISGATAGEGGLVWVEGPAGIGKTSLLLETVRRGRAAGALTSRARGDELERAFAFGAVRQLLERPLAGLGDDGAALLEGPAAAAAPMLSDVASPQDAEASGDNVSQRVLSAFVRIVEALADTRPVVLVVDDAHWLDRPSLLALRFLARRIQDLPVAVVIGTRTGEPGADLDILSALAAEPDTVVLRPPPLSADGVAAVVAGRHPSAAPDLAEACVEASSGNPFLLAEVLRALAADSAEPTAARVRALAPGSIRRAVLVRLARLGPDAGDLARALAVLGAGAELGEASALARLELRAAGVAADALVTSEILDTADPPVFVHPVVAAAIGEDIAGGMSAALHRRAAELLRGVPEKTERAAAHLLRAPGSGERWAAEILQSAAAQATARGAAASAAALLQRALAEPAPSEMRQQLQLELGRAFRHGDIDAAVDQLRVAAGGPDLAIGAVAAGQLAVLLWANRRSDEAFEVADGVLERAHELPPTVALELEVFLRHAVPLSVPTMRPEQACEEEAAARKLVVRLEPGTPQWLRAADTVLQWDLAHGRDADGCAGGALDLLEGGLCDALDVGGWEWPLSIGALFLADRFSEAGRWLDETEGRLPAEGGHVLRLLVCFFRSETAYRSGDLAEAEAHGRTGMEIARPFGTGMVLALLSAVVHAQVERGHAEAAQALLVEHGVWAFDVDTPGSPFGAMSARGRLKLALGDLGGGAEDLLAMGAKTTMAGWENPAMNSWRSTAAIALAALGRTDQARELAEAELELARLWGAPRTVGQALRGVAAAEPDMGRRIDLLSEAASAMEASPARLTRAHVLADLGTALRRDRRLTEAREPLRIALDLAMRCDADPLAERVRTELRLAGARPRRSHLSGVESLTPAELVTARLAAEGLTNAEIAQRRYLARKTVEKQISAVLMKLDISSRTELAETLQPSSG